MLKRILPALLLSIAVPQLAAAQATVIPYVSAQEEHDSNIHRLPNSEASVIAYNDPKLGDTDTRLTAGAEGTYLWGVQRLTGTLEGRQIYYDHYSDLNHFEYLANLALKWTLTRLLDGNLQFRQEQLSAPFTYNQSPGLEVDTDRNLVAKLNLHFKPEWRLETGANYHYLHAPLQFYPDFVERETGTHLGLVYTGVANLTFGIALDHLDGDYANAPNVGAYSQTDASINANYVVNGLTTFSGSIGDTRRTQRGGEENNVSALTGQIKYTRQLTGKTSLKLQLVRAVNSYLAAGGAEVDSTALIGLTWLATRRIGVDASYGYTRSTFTGQSIPGSTATGRADHSPQETLDITYQALKRLQIKAYYSGQSRTSTFEEFGYSDAVVGIQATVRWQ